MAATHAAQAGSGARGFDRERLPDPASYYEAQGLNFRERRGKWRTTGCAFHDGSDSMRVNMETGAFVCMAGCGARGGDVLAYHMASHSLDFVEGAKALGAWTGGEETPKRPTSLPARDALQVLYRESVLLAVAAANLANGVVLTPADLARVLQASARIKRIAEVFA